MLKKCFDMNPMTSMHVVRNLKRLCIAVAFLIIAFASQAQKRTYDTIPYVPDYYYKRLALFNQESFEKGKIIFLGNSITEFGNWKKLLKDSSVINRGIAGDITFGVLFRLDEVIAHQPSKLFIKIGINDIAKNIPDKVIVENILKMVVKVKTRSPETRVFIISILPTNDSVKTEYPDVFNKNTHVVTVNNQLMRNTKKLDFTFIDLYSEITDKHGNLDARYTVGDGLHLNDLGYQLWVELLGKYL
ncbi:MAG: sialate O-acetylesterase [Marivirga sp.]|nr:sialate O-acetylesterase [Marivirga sp.]